MRHLNTLAALCALTFAVPAAHAGSLPFIPDLSDTHPACEDAQYLGALESVSAEFGDDDFGGSAWSYAGLVVPDSQSLAYWCIQYEWNSHFINLNEGMGLSNLAIPYRQPLLVAEDMIEEFAEVTYADAKVQAVAGADVTLFGHTEDVFYARGQVRADGGQAIVEVMGLSVIDESFSTDVDKTYPATFFSATQGVNLGIFELSARADLTGTLGVTALLSASGDGLTGEVTPSAGLEVNAEAILDILIASAGVTGSLNLLNAAVPTNITINSDGWSLTADLVVTALDGIIEIFGEFMGATARETIAAWNGLTLFDTTLFAEGGDF